MHIFKKQIILQNKMNILLCCKEANFLSLLLKVVISFFFALFYGGSDLQNSFKIWWRTLTLLLNEDIKLQQLNWGE